jgi:hypothetical protein
VKEEVIIKIAQLVYEYKMRELLLEAYFRTRDEEG